MFVVGLTGGISCGKSTVNKMFCEAGGSTRVVDADAVAHTVLAPGTSTAKKVLHEFRQFNITDEQGNIDRTKLGEVVFKDSGLRRKLVKMQQLPILFSMLREILTAALSGAEFIMLDIPLLYETKLFVYICDAVMVVDVPDDQQLSRLMARNGYSEEHARERIAAQMPKAKKAKLADYVIDNGGTRLETRAQVEKVVALMRGRRKVMSRLTLCCIVCVLAPLGLAYLGWRAIRG
eukprot:Hpha_TRINITY_DN18959_c0_g1::TRINITY_DN18959_c0_g1_i1::g.17450::m.17450